MLKAVNLLGFYVKDTAASTAFYKRLGFGVVRDDGAVAEVKLGDVHLQFIAQETAADLGESFQKDAFGEPKGTGIYINVEVSDIDDYYQGLLDSGIKPSAEPKNWPWGHREFVVRDPDRYKLVFYEKLSEETTEELL